MTILLIVLVAGVGSLLLALIVASAIHKDEDDS